MSKQEKLTAFIDAQIAFPRMTGPYRHAAAYPYGFLAQQRPTAEQLAEELLGFAEFRALQLGTWLGTTDGQVDATAAAFKRGDGDDLVHGAVFSDQHKRHGQSQRVRGGAHTAETGRSTICGPGTESATSNQKVLPRPNPLVSAPIVPPISSTSSRAIARPRPVPP